MSRDCLNVCSSTGVWFFHSIIEVSLLVCSVFREFDILSHSTQMNMIVATNEIIDPRDEIVFHVEKLSL